MGFEEEALEAHNKYRAMHGAPPLTLNREICQVAQAWAQQNASRGSFQHSSQQQRMYRGQAMGENLAGGSGTNMTGEYATKMWYDEIKDYNFSRQGFSGATGHFTQVVWKGTLEFGIGIAQGPRGNTVVCANYFPAGNMMGDFERNVFPPNTTYNPPDDDKTNGQGNNIMGGLQNLNINMGFEEEALEAHNKYRAMHGAPPLTLNKEICQVAQAWAQQNASRGSFQHSSQQQRMYRGQAMGENLAGGSGTNMTGEYATKMWYDEIKDYNFSRQGFSGATGHFTQVVWKGTLEFGIGIAQGPGGNTVVCANYFPAGNMMGDFERNVFPPNTTYNPPDDDKNKSQTNGQSNMSGQQPSNIKMGFEEEALEAHNKYRAMHGAPPLTLNKEICQVAKAWAQQNASRGSFQHSSQQQRMYRGKAMGENLAGGSGTNMTGEYATKMWYDEIKDYNFSRQGFSCATGHFTQVVWKGTLEFGIGIAQGPRGNTVVCANYFPAGNMRGDFERNVFPPNTTYNPPDDDKNKSQTNGQGNMGGLQPSGFGSNSMMPQGFGGGGGFGCGGGSVSKSTKTITVTEDRGDGLKTYIKTIVTETRTDASGNKTVTTTENETVQ